MSFSIVSAGQAFAKPRPMSGQGPRGMLVPTAPACAPGDQEADMTKIIECDDGFVVRGDDGDELVANALAHIRTAHPQLGAITRQQLLAMAVEV
jgi:predicted small metal-binding protein